MANRLHLTSACILAAVSLMAARPLAQSAPDTKENLRVVITGGKLAGTYNATSIKGGCSTGANGPGSWGNAFSLATAGPSELGSLSLIVPDAKAAAAGTKQFFVSFGFGPIMKRTSIDIETRPTEKKLAGSGTVMVKDAGSTATVTIDVTAADGASVHATIDCKSVIRM